MSERKERFTPGPWMADGPWGNGGIRLARVGENFSIHVAGIDCISPADYNLIAAAPDMYAALEGLVDMIETELSVGSGTTCDFKRRVLPNARAALAKARGES